LKSTADRRLPTSTGAKGQTADGGGAEGGVTDSNTRQSAQHMNLQIRELEELRHMSIGSPVPLPRNYDDDEHAGDVTDVDYLFDESFPVIKVDACDGMSMNAQSEHFDGTQRVKSVTCVSSKPGTRPPTNGGGGKAVGSVRGDAFLHQGGEGKPLRAAQTSLTEPAESRISHTTKPKR